jgi:hypothetical protein
MEQTLGFGIVLGLLVGFANERVTSLWLSRLLKREMTAVLPFIKLFVWGLYLAKHAVLWVGMYVLFSRAHLSLLGFAVGILTYQLYRLAWLLSRTDVRLAGR